jgi:hypothetical protein
MIELAIIGLLMWGSYEHGQASVDVPTCPSVALSTVECPEIYPPSNDNSTTYIVKCQGKSYQGFLAGLLEEAGLTIRSAQVERKPLHIPRETA